MARSWFKHPSDLPRLPERRQPRCNHVARPGAAAPPVADINPTEDRAHTTSVLTMLNLIAPLRTQGHVGQPQSRPCTIPLVTVAWYLATGVLRAADGPENKPENETAGGSQTGSLPGETHFTPPSSVGRAHPW
jgi:hypothetical protein